MPMLPYKITSTGKLIDDALEDIEKLPRTFRAWLLRSKDTPFVSENWRAALPPI